MTPQPKPMTAAELADLEAVCKRLPIVTDTGYGIVAPESAFAIPCYDHAIRVAIVALVNAAPRLLAMVRRVKELEKILGKAVHGGCTWHEGTDYNEAHAILEQPQ